VNQIRLAFAVSGALLLGSVPARAQDPAAQFLRASILGSAAPERAVLDSLYHRRDDAPLWDQGTGYSDLARAAIVTLRAAAERGLDPRDYGVPRLDSILNAHADGDPARRAARDLLLSGALVRFLGDLRDGRVPDSPFAHLKAATPPERQAELIARAGRGVAVEALAREVEPKIAQYRSLLRQLARYRQLATTLDPRPLPAVTVRPGQRYAGRTELWRRLVSFGDLPAVSFVASARYDSTLEDGVRRFQARHALTPDGILGPATRKALDIPPATRIQQISLALERLRWLPSLDGQRLIVVNVPAFELFAFDSIGGAGEPALRMSVVTGGSFDNRTPVMLQPLRTVEFRPYWNVPKGIMTKEILPILRRDPEYLRTQQMEVLGVRDSVLEDSLTPEILTALGEGRFRIRQRPGPWNALGLTKFTFPNTDAIYLHGSPDTTAFSRSRRDLSHGCIRLQDPPALALWALQGARGWGLERIDEALNGGDTLRAAVVKRTSVLIFYTTAVATVGGDVVFYEDIYGHDETLREALAGRKREG
jgi:L,D-transpeptidase YcbB